MNFTQWTILSLFAFCGTGVLAADKPESAEARDDAPAFELKYRFSTGDQWHYSLKDQGTKTSITPSVETSAVNNSSQSKHYRVVQVREDGSAILEVIFDRFVIDFTATDINGKKHGIAFDTNSGKEPPAELKGLKSSIGKPFARFLMSPSGEITDLTFPQADEQNELKQAEQRKGLPIPFPAEPIPVGKSWSEKIDVELQIQPETNPRLKQDFTVQTIYQLKSIEDGIAEISLNTIVQPRITNAQLRGKMMPFLPKGIIRFDTNRGRILTRTEFIDARELGVGGPQTVLIIENKKVETLIDPQREGLAN